IVRLMNKIQTAGESRFFNAVWSSASRLGEASGAAWVRRPTIAPSDRLKAGLQTCFRAPLSTLDSLARRSAAETARLPTFGPVMSA
ncbi:MAG: hypothetical protein ABSG25_14870, partial [Bryobacteraceae bacterium]